jgi:hypothetical protein
MDSRKPWMGRDQQVMPPMVLIDLQADAERAWKDNTLNAPAKHGGAELINKSSKRKRIKV